MCIRRLSPQYTGTSGSPAALPSTSTFNVLAHGAGVGQGLRGHWAFVHSSLDGSS